jgi:hypothetical protein
MNYYFLAASLPPLSLEEEPPLSVEAFLAICDVHLAPQDRATLDALLADEQKTSAPALVREWRNRETRIRNSVVAARAARLEVEAGPHLRPQDGISLYIEDAVHKALSRQTPLARELALDELRWDEADEFAGHNPFALRAILSYAVKLRVAWRWAAMDEDAGTTTLNEIINRPTGTDEVQEKTA